MQNRINSIIINDIAKDLKQKIGSEFTDKDFEHIRQKLEELHENISILETEMIDEILYEENKLWNDFHSIFIERENPKCTICKESGKGDYLDENNNRVILCQSCFDLNKLS